MIPAGWTRTASRGSSTNSRPPGSTSGRPSRSSGATLWTSSTSAFPRMGALSLAQYWIEVREALKRINKTSEYMEALSLPGNSLPDYLGYDYISNVVKLALGAAAAPAYYRNGTQAMLYSGLLFLIAIQLVRAIDEEGIKWASQAFQEENSLAVKLDVGDPATATSYRPDCNKVARNSRVFAEAFNCSEGSRMNPVKKCSFFE
ncbi:hypothetical protein MRX96_022600 [Rhipicephalus microplus]